MQARGGGGIDGVAEETTGGRAGKGVCCKEREEENGEERGEQREPEIERRTERQRAPEREDPTRERLCVKEIDRERNRKIFLFSDVISRGNMRPDLIFHG